MGNDSTVIEVASQEVPLSDRDVGASGKDFRRRFCLEQVAQTRIKSKNWESLEKVLTKLSFLEQKVGAGMVFELAEDFASAARYLPAERPWGQVFRLLQEALGREMHFIDRHRSTLFQCLWNLCWWYDCAQARCHYELCEEERAKGEWPWNGTGQHLCTLLESWCEEKNEKTPEFLWVRSIRPLPERLSTGTVAVLHGHEDGVRGMAIPPDEKRLFSIANDGKWCVWKRESGILENDYDLDRNASELPKPRSIAFSASGKTWAGMWKAKEASDSGKYLIQVLDTESGQERASIRANVIDDRYGSRGSIAHVMSVTDDGLVVVGRESIQCWDSRTGAEISSTVPSDTVTAVALWPDGKKVAVGGAGLRIWTIAASVQNVRKAEPYIKVIVLSNNGKYLATGTRYGYIQVWNTETWNCVGWLRASDSTVTPPAVTDLLFAFDDKFLVASCEDGTVRTWELGTVVGIGWFRRAVRRLSDELAQSVLHNFDRPAKCLSISDKGKKIYVGCSDGDIRVVDPVAWDSSDTQELRLKSPCSGINTEHHGRVERKKVKFSLDGSVIVTCTTDGKRIHVWCTRSGECLHSLQRRWYLNVVSPEPITCWHLTGDGKQIVAGDWSGRIHVWDVATGHLVRHWKVSRHGVSALSLSPMCGRLACGAGDELSVWNIQNASREMKAVAEEWSIEKVEFDATGENVVSFEGEGVSLWQAATGKFIKRIRIGDAEQFAYSATRSLIATWDGRALYLRDFGERKKGVCLMLNWHLGVFQSLYAREEDETEYTIRIDGKTVMDMAFSKDGTMLVVTDSTKVTRLFDVDNGKWVKVITGVTDVHALIDGQSGYSAFVRDNVTIIAETATGKDVACFSVAPVMIVAHPRQPIWAGGVGNQLYLFQLERGIPFGGKASDEARPRREAEKALTWKKKDVFGSAVWVILLWVGTAATWFVGGDFISLWGLLSMGAVFGGMLLMLQWLEKHPPRFVGGVPLCVIGGGPLFSSGARMSWHLVGDGFSWWGLLWALLGSFAAFYAFMVMAEWFEKIRWEVVGIGFLHSMNVLLTCWLVREGFTWWLIWWVVLSGIFLLLSFGLLIPDKYKSYSKDEWSWTSAGSKSSARFLQTDEQE